jgi:hypothetical protein
MVAAYKYGIRAQLPRHFYRHGTSYAKGPCLVAAAGYHTAVTGSAYYQWDMLKSPVAQAFHTHKKAVQVHVRNVFFHDKNIDKK